MTYNDIFAGFCYSFHLNCFPFTGCWRCNSNLVHKSWTKGGVNKVSEELKLTVTLYKFISDSCLLSTHLYQPAELEIHSC